MQDSTRKLGKTFTWIGWILGFLLLSLLIDKLLQQQANPNQQLRTANFNGSPEVVLQRNRQGHYVFTGRINGTPVDFLIDTGATTTSIPETIANNLNLAKGMRFNVSTANGNTFAWDTRLDSLQIGDIELNQVRASINPGFKGDEVLLGMNVLKHLELVQTGDQLTLRIPG